MAVRLNNAMRQEILANAMDGAFDNVVEQARKDLYVAARAVFENGHTQHFKAIKSLPDGMASVSSQNMSIQFKPKRGVKTHTVEVPRNYKYGLPKSLYNYETNQHVEVDGYINERMSDESRGDHFPVCNSYTMKLKTTPADPTLVKELRKAFDYMSEVVAKKDKLNKTLNAVLQGSYSIEKLVETWPNAARYLPELPVVGKAMVINIPELEDMLELANS